MSFVEAEAILAQALGSSTATEANEDRAELCAAAVDAAITTALGGYEVEADSAAEAELARAALLDGVAAYQAFDTPSGVLTTGPDGQPVRLPVDILRASWPVIHRYKLPGFA